MIYFQGRTATWDSILLLCHNIKVGFGGVVRGLHLGSSALSILPVLDPETDESVLQRGIVAILLLTACCCGQKPIGKSRLVKLVHRSALIVTYFHNRNLRRVYIISICLYRFCDSCSQNLIVLRRSAYLMLFSGLFNISIVYLWQNHLHYHLLE